MISIRKMIFLFLLKLKGSKRNEYYKKMLEYEKFSEDKLKIQQEDELKKLLLHAYENVPYYTKTLKEACVIEKDKINLDNFENIPILTKDILKKNLEELKSYDHESRGSYVNHSGGSSGEPTEFLQDKDYFDWGMAGRNYWNHMAGHEMGQKFFRLWGSERDLMGQKAPLRKRIEKWLINMEELNAFRMTKENMFEYVEKINNEKPSLIEAYVNPMYELATFAEKENLEIIPPKAIITSAGTLYPDMKEKIERVFGCPVWNRYGTREVGDMACGKDRLKIATWTHYVETVDKKGEITEDVGRVLVTNLRNYSMPLIRYDIGDIAKLDKEWGYFEKVEGREVAVLKTKDGRIVSGLLFVHYFGVVMNNGFIKRFQLIQKDYDKIEIKVIVNDRKKFEGKKVEIADLIEKAMGYRCKINWIETENIEPLKSGKYLYVKSEI